MLLLRTSAAAKSPHLTIHHAFARLNDLKAQLRHLQAAAAAEAAQQRQKQLLADKQQAVLQQSEAAKLQEAQAAQQQIKPQSTSLPVQIPLDTVVPAPRQHQSKGQLQPNPVSKPAPPSSSSNVPSPHQTHPHTVQSASASPAGLPSATQRFLQPQPSGQSASAAEQQAASLRPTRHVNLLSKPAPVGLLEIQAEQEAESARAAEAAAEASSSAASSKAANRASGSHASPSTSAPQKSQARVLQVLLLHQPLTQQLLHASKLH